MTNWIIGAVIAVLVLPVLVPLYVMMYKLTIEMLEPDEPTIYEQLHSQRPLWEGNEDGGRIYRVIPEYT